MTQRTCEEDGCERPHISRGYCTKHRDQRYHAGLLPPLPKPTDEERFWPKVDKNGPRGCWLWLAAKWPGGYGSFTVGGKSVKAYRFSYELLVGPIPQGLQIDHLCRNPQCVNPNHLEPVTSKVNNHRSGSPIPKNALKTHCAKGHPFDEENTYVRVVNRNTGATGRFCRQCQRDVCLRQYYRRQAAS